MRDRLAGCHHQAAIGDPALEQGRKRVECASRLPAVLEKFVQAIREHQPIATGMSVLLTTCFKSVTATVDAIREAGLRDTVKLMVGGAAASDLLRENAGCDLYGKTAVDGAKFASELAGVE